MTSKIVRADQTILDGILSVTYREQVNGDADLRPGCVASAYIEVKAAGSQSDAPAAGEALTYYQVDGNGAETMIGVFYAEPSVPTRNTYRFTAYDAAAKLDADYSARLQAIQQSFPMTIYALVSDACAAAGVTLGSASWPLSTQTVNAFYADGLTCRNILQYAAELGCRFVRCDTGGAVVFDWYAAASGYRIHPESGTSGGETRIPYKQSGLDYENYDTAALSRVAVHPVGTEDAAYIYPTSAASGNTLHIRGNLLLTGAGAALHNAAAQQIYTTMAALGPYRPMTVQLFPGMNPFRAGQIVPVTDIQGVPFVSPVMAMTTAPDAATLTATGNRTYGAGTDAAKALAQLAADIVQIGRLKVGWAEIDQAIINSLTAHGIDADWINAGALTVRDNMNRVLFRADKDANEVEIAGWLADNAWQVLTREETYTGFSDKTMLANGIVFERQNSPRFDQRGLSAFNTRVAGHSSSDGWLGISLYANDGSSPNGGGSVDIGSDGVNIESGGGIFLNDREILEEVGDLADLDTTDKSSLVAAINELIAGLTPVATARFG